MSDNYSKPPVNFRKQPTDVNPGAGASPSPLASDLPLDGISANDARDPGYLDQQIISENV